MNKNLLNSLFKERNKKKDLFKKMSPNNNDNLKGSGVPVLLDKNFVGGTIITRNVQKYKPIKLKL